MFRFKNFFSLVNNLLPKEMTQPEVYRKILDDQASDDSQISKMVNGKTSVPAKVAKQVIVSGVWNTGIRLESAFPQDKYNNFWENIDKRLNQKPLNDKKPLINLECFTYYDPESTAEKVAILLIEALLNELRKTSVEKASITSCNKSVDTTINESHPIYTSSFLFLKNEDLENMKGISFMFHSGTNWITDHSPHGPGGLLKEITDKKIDVRVLINNSPEIQSIFDTGYLNSRIGGEYDTADLNREKWLKLAQKYHFCLRSFPYIFFHCLCIVEYKNDTKKIYVSNYIYKEGMAVEEHPKTILTNNDPDLNTYYSEFEFIWGKSETMCNPKMHLTV